MALEKFNHISLIFGYLLENHVRKSDDFSLTLVEFRLLRISNLFIFSNFKISDLPFFPLQFLGKGKVTVWR